MTKQNPNKTKMWRHNKRDTFNMMKNENNEEEEERYVD
jgi:hypothetical protein